MSRDEREDDRKRAPNRATSNKCPEREAFPTAIIKRKSRDPKIEIGERGEKKKERGNEEKKI